ncbi:hypothetical protein KAX06_05330 [candidate division WOR-3 bacterium]|nr:hypothetical protein [candidate division WOR-3 bacterium]MCK4334187.1 hypothetical protein [candidate division WOR-3 bacterium]
MSKGKPKTEKTRRTLPIFSPKTPPRTPKPSSSGEGGGATVGNGSPSEEKKCVCTNSKCENYKKEVPLKEVNCSEQLCKKCKQPLKPAWVLKTQGKQA